LANIEHEYRLAGNGRRAAAIVRSPALEFGRYFATETASGEARGRRLAPRASGSRTGRGPGNKQLNKQPVFH
jgi:hypothetical protein